MQKLSRPREQVVNKLLWVGSLQFLFPKQFIATTHILYPVYLILQLTLHHPDFSHPLLPGLLANCTPPHCLLAAVSHRCLMLAPRVRYLGPHAAGKRSRILLQFHFFIGEVPSGILIVRAGIGVVIQLIDGPVPLVGLPFVLQMLRTLLVLPLIFVECLAHLNSDDI